MSDTVQAAFAGKPRILFVEDEAALREHLAQMLSEDYVVDTAGNGAEALQAVLRVKPELVVTDVVMPDIDGIELLRILRSTPSTQAIPVLLISGRAPEALRIEGFEKGADGFLAKPYTEREMKARIHAMLQAARTRIEAVRREAREQAEQQAMAEQAALLESITDGFYALDRQWRFTYINQRALDYFGKTREEVLGKNAWDLVPAGKGTMFQTQYERAVREQCSVDFEVLSPFSGRWVDVHAYPTPQGLAVTFRDITTRKLAEEALSQAEERLRRAVTIGTVGVLFFRLDGRITDANHAFERMSGYSNDELRAMTHWEALTAPEFRLVTEQAAQELALRGETVPYEKQLMCKDGSRCWGLFAPTRLSGGGPESECVEFIIDITQGKRAEAALRASEEALREADRRKNEFLATLAHELRNPLAPLKNGLQIARLTSKTDSPVQRTLDMMDRQLSHLVHLVNDLLDVARVSSGKIVLRKGSVMLADVLVQSTEASRPMIDAREQQLIIEKTPEDLSVDGDFDRLAQVFSNLLSNAAKYTETGGRICVKLARQKNEAVIQVIDTGIGIPAQDLPHVFDLFSQVREHQGHTEGGLGIGLSLVKTLVDLHGGSITADSAGPGAGSTFSVRLPLCKIYALATSEVSRQTEGVADFQRLRILVADDNTDAATSLAALLEMVGHDVRTVADGEQAVTQSREFCPEVIFMDIGMPRMDGLEAARRIRALPGGKKIAIVALTGWGQQVDRQRTQSSGFDAHLVKPVDGAAVAEVLRSKRSG